MLIRFDTLRLVPKLRGSTADIDGDVRTQLLEPLDGVHRRIGAVLRAEHHLDRPGVALVGEAEQTRQQVRLLPAQRLENRDRWFRRLMLGALGRATKRNASTPAISANTQPIVAAATQRLPSPRISASADINTPPTPASPIAVRTSTLARTGGRTTPREQKTSPAVTLMPHPARGSGPRPSFGHGVVRGAGARGRRGRRGSRRALVEPGFARGPGPGRNHTMHSYT